MRPLVGAPKIKPGSIDALVVKYLQHYFFTRGLAKATQAARRPILDNFRQCMTPGGHRYGENRLATMQQRTLATRWQSRRRPCRRSG